MSEPDDLAYCRCGAVLGVPESRHSAECLRDSMSESDRLIAGIRAADETYREAGWERAREVNEGWRHVAVWACIACVVAGVLIGHFLW